MANLYIANCTKQEHLLTYMLPENPRPFHHTIRAGGQIQIPGDTDTLNRIIDQHTIYGMQPADKVARGFGGLCYRLDKPISLDAIMNGFTQSEQDAIDKALEARKNTAAAADKIIGDKAQEMGVRQKSGLELEIIEEKRNAADNDSKFQQTIEVVREGAEPIKGRGRQRKSA